MTAVVNSTSVCATDLDAAMVVIELEPLGPAQGVRLELRQLELDKPWVVLSADEAARVSQALQHFAGGSL